jgi:hypothetical protein
MLQLHADRTVPGPTSKKPRCILRRVRRPTARNWHGFCISAPVSADVNGPPPQKPCQFRAVPNLCRPRKREWGFFEVGPAVAVDGSGVAAGVAAFSFRLCAPWRNQLMDGMTAWNRPWNRLGYYQLLRQQKTGTTGVPVVIVQLR